MLEFSLSQVNKPAAVLSVENFRHQLDTLLAQNRYISTRRKAGVTALKSSVTLLPSTLIGVSTFTSRPLGRKYYLIELAFNSKQKSSERKNISKLPPSILAILKVCPKIKKSSSLPFALLT